MKKKVCLLIAMTVMMGTISVSAAREILVFIDRERVVSDVAPQIMNDRDMLPFRSVFEKLGADVEWLESEKKIIAKGDNIQVEMTVGEKNMLIKSKTF